jgi:hypothetical protein
VGNRERVGTEKQEVPGQAEPSVPLSTDTLQFLDKSHQVIKLNRLIIVLMKSLCRRQHKPIQVNWSREEIYWRTRELTPRIRRKGRERTQEAEMKASVSILAANSVSLEDAVFFCFVLLAALGFELWNLHLSHTSSPFWFRLFHTGVPFGQEPTSDHDTPTYASHITEITVMLYHPSLFIEIGSH